MAISLHTASTYQIEYKDSGIWGYEKIDNLIHFLQEKQVSMDGIWVSEDEMEIEIDFDTLELLKDDKVWGTQIQGIIDDADKNNTYAHLTIW